MGSKVGGQRGDGLPALPGTASSPDWLQFSGAQLELWEPQWHGEVTDCQAAVSGWVKSTR